MSRERGYEIRAIKMNAEAEIRAMKPKAEAQHEGT